MIYASVISKNERSKPMRKWKKICIMLAYMMAAALLMPSVSPFTGTAEFAEAATKIKLNKTSLTLYVGETATLKLTGTDKTVKWFSSKKTVAAVSSKGKVTAKKAGTAVITATVNNKSYKCKVTVKDYTTVYGQLTKINGKKITLALGTLNTPQDNGMAQTGGDTAPATTPNETSVNQQNAAPAMPVDIQAPAAPTNETDEKKQKGTQASPQNDTSNGTSDTQQGGTPPAPPGGMSGMPQPDGNTGNPGNRTDKSDGNNKMPELLTLSGETLTIKISDTSILSKETIDPMNQTSENSTDTSDSDVSLSDITVGCILKVVYKESAKNLVSVTILKTGRNEGMAQGAPGIPGGGQGGTFAGGSGNMQGGGPVGGSVTAYNGTSAYSLSDGESLTGGTYTSTNSDENAIRADSVTASLTDVTVEKTAGDSSNNDASSFYGLNSAILALGTAKLDITGGAVTAKAEGANGVFAYGDAVINIKDTVINVSGGNAGGIQVAGGGTLYATNLTVNSKVKAAIRSDRGGGTMVVNGGTFTTSGSSGAPAIYSTADITVNDAVLTSDNSEAVVVEGFNSVTLNNCTVTGNMSGTYGAGSGENIHNVMLYQSMSGDAEVGNSSFTMNGGSLTSKNGDMFYITNTESNVTLNNVKLTLASGTNLLTVAGNDGSRGWGKAGANGGTCNFTVTAQTLTGDIEVDSISQLELNIKENSNYTGAINKDGTTAKALTVTLDSTSTWTLTGDSYITEFNGSLENVITNGYTLYVNNVAVK